MRIGDMTKQELKKHMLDVIDKEIKNIENFYGTLREIIDVDSRKKELMEQRERISNIETEVAI